MGDDDSGLNRQPLQLIPVLTLDMLLSQEWVTAAIVTKVFNFWQKGETAAFQLFQDFKESHQHRPLAVLGIPGIDRRPRFHDQGAGSINQFLCRVGDRIIVLPVSGTQP
ncbi:hypothetical protein D3C85_1313270 [compost metagenome]